MLQVSLMQRDILEELVFKYDFRQHRCVTHLCRLLRTTAGVRIESALLSIYVIV